MMSTNNILHPANGHPIIVPSQDIVLGLYYLSIVAEGAPGEGKAFADIGEMEHAIAEKVVHATTPRSATAGRARTPTARSRRKFYDTTPGRVILSRLLPDNPLVPVRRRQQADDEARDLRRMIDAVYRNCGQKETVIFCDRIMSLGFHHAFKAGISFGKDDMVVPENKWEIVDETRTLAKDYEQQYQDGLITQGEKYNKVVDAWAKCSDRLAGEMMNRISSVQKDENGRDMPVNSIFMMSHSGARGSPAQMKQLAAMRGLMAKPSGEIIESPIISNFKEGLNVLEYFNSTHGARKGLADTALKTANSGYLTRRLVDVAQDAVIREPDCGTDKGIRMRAIVDAGQVVASLGSRILGRFVAEDVVGSGRKGHRPCPHDHDRGRPYRRDHEGRHPGGEDPLRAGLRLAERRLCDLLRARPRARHAGQHGRGGGRHRGAVDRRARHAAHDADLPHRRRGADRRSVLRRIELRGHGRHPQPHGRQELRRRPRWRSAATTPS